MNKYIWELSETRFNLLLDNLPITKSMRKALRMRYESNNSWSRASCAIKFDLSEHGIMKAEKRLLEANERFKKEYGN